MTNEVNGQTPDQHPVEVNMAAECIVEEEYSVPEADRLFAPPTAEEAAHSLRELEWGEHIVGTRMAAARGNSKTYIYSLQEAATFFFDFNSGSSSLSTHGAFAWIDIDKFIVWFRETIADIAFADALEQGVSHKENYNDQIETLRQLLMLRYAQYQPFLPQEDEEAVSEQEPEEVVAAH